MDYTQAGELVKATPAKEAAAKHRNQWCPHLAEKGSNATWHSRL